jgi:putative hydrolase of HD superfamily
LWHEYETAVTAEAKIVKDFDKFEMIMQAHEYEKGLISCCQFDFDNSSRSKPGGFLSEHKGGI